MAAVEQIDVELTIVVGEAELSLARVLQLGRGAVVELGRDAAAPVALMANGRPIAKGKVMLVGDRVAVEIAA